MTPRELKLSPSARLDIARHGRALADARGRAFAETWVRDFTAWLRGRPSSAP